TRFSRDWSSDVCSSDLTCRWLIPEVKFNSGYFTRLVSARNSESTEGFFISRRAFLPAGNLRKQYAVDGRAAQRFQRGGGGVPLRSEERRVGKECTARCA